MRLSSVLFSILFAAAGLHAQAPSGTARPAPKVVLTNSLDAITGTGIPTAPRRPEPTNAGRPKTEVPVVVVDPAAPPTTSAVPSGSSSAGSDDVWAEGQGVRVTRSAVNAKVSRAVAEAVASGRVLTERELAELRARTLNTMVFVQLVLGRATAADTNRARFESKSRIDGILKNAPSEDVFWKTVLAAGYTQESFLAEKFEEALVVTILDREVKARVKIPDSDVRRYYEEEPARWQKPEQVRAAQIFFATVTPDDRKPLPAEAVAAQRKKAEEALAKVKAGGDFAALAKELSEDPVSRPRGGEYVLQRKQMFDEFDQFAFSAKPGETSGIVESKVGLHLFRKIEVLPARTVPLEEVADQIREMLVQREMEVRIPEFADLLKASTGLRMAASAPRPMGF